MTDLLTLEDLDLPTLRGVHVLVRVDFNVPMKEGAVADDTRLVEALPTLRELAATGARLMLVSHLGRPKGERQSKFTLQPVAARLGELLAREVAFAEDCIGEPAAAAAAALGDGELVLLENLRFHQGEERNNSDFARALAANAAAYVDDAFGAAHRAHASIVGVVEHLPRRAAGRLLVREVAALERLLGEPERPFAAIVGGAKIEGKIDTLDNLLPRLDVLMVGGGMANTFLAARGVDMQGSLVERERLALAGDLARRAAARGVELVLPTDVVVADRFDDPSDIRTVDVEEIPADFLALDIGPATRAAFAREIARARTLFWNGPLGVFEKPPFDQSTRAIAEALAACAGFTLIGGGETVAAARQAGVTAQLGHVSTGGGAALELLAGLALPGVVALERR
ncbi:MAG TPA: phosphoglycerate kinase [Thermoanaerobaculia bacterium]|jgi:phosphoglycerate kinase